jgi:hypothetical protein
VIFVGDDWAEGHHDVCVLDEQGARLAKRRLPEGLAGVAQLHALLAEHASEPGEVVIGIETDRGLWVAALLEAGYEVYAINTAGSQSLPRPPRSLGRQERPRRRPGAGRSGAHRLPPAPRRGSRQHAR